jgi:DMSO/TMAO reductase YedYZ molybdopterin-dependent catalytic subunit
MAMWPLKTNVTRREALTALGGAILASRAKGQAVGKRNMIVRSARPLDLEMPLSGFGDYLTPVEHFFVRTHVYSPTVNLGSWRLKIDGNVAQPLELSIDDLRKLPPVELPAVLECAGNGRSFYDPPVAGLQWKYGAVGNGLWRGVRLAEVLKRAGVKAGSVEVLFDGADLPIGKMADFRRSIPISKAQHADTLLAYNLNGQSLPVEHGFPLRAVVPGWAGDSWTKWLTGVRVLTERDTGYWMTNTYKHPGRPVAPGTVLPAAGLPPLTSLRVKSVISSPEPGGTVKPGEPVLIRGAAWSGESGPVQRVNVSVDTGRTWSASRFLDPQTRWGWRRWEFRWTPTTERFHTIFARAEDAHEIQPAAQEWNQSGYLWNIVSSVSVQVAKDAVPAAVTQSAAPQEVPTLLKDRCMTCHQDDMIRGQRLTRAQWDREITKMTDWGANLSPADRTSLLDYLSSAFPVNR